MANIDDIAAEDMAATVFDVDATESPAETATYTPPGGEGVSITAVLLPEDAEIDSDEHGDVQIRRRRAVIPTDPDIGVEEPAIRAELTIGQTQWKVTAIESKGQGKAILAIMTDTPTSKHHEQHKRRIE